MARFGETFSLCFNKPLTILFNWHSDSKSRSILSTQAIDAHSAAKSRCFQSRIDQAEIPSPVLSQACHHSDFSAESGHWLFTSEVLYLYRRGFTLCTVREALTIFLTCDWIAFECICMIFNGIKFSWFLLFSVFYRKLQYPEINSQ